MCFESLGLTSRFLDLQQGHIFDDFGLFDSVLPNIFASTPFLDVEPQEIVTPEVPGLIETPGMSPFSLSERPVDPALPNAPTSPTSQNIDPVFQEETDPTMPGYLVTRNQDATTSYTHLRAQDMSSISDISSHDHEKLLELCKRVFCSAHRLAIDDDAKD